MSEPQDRAIWLCLWVPKVFHAVEKCTPISEELEYSRAQATTHVHHIYWYPYITTCLALGVLFNPDILYAFHSGYSPGVLKLAQESIQKSPDSLQSTSSIWGLFAIAYLELQRISIPAQSFRLPSRPIDTSKRTSISPEKAKTCLRSFAQNFSMLPIDIPCAYGLMWIGRELFSPRKGMRMIIVDIETRLRTMAKIRSVKTTYKISLGKEKIETSMGIRMRTELCKTLF